MPRPRKPNNLHQVQGTYRGDRQGQKIGDLPPLDPKPPRHLTPNCRKAWAEIATAGEGYLARSDAIAVELAANLMALVREGVATGSKIAILERLLHKLGCTPAGRQALPLLAASQTKGNPFDELRNERR